MIQQSTTEQLYLKGAGEREPFLETARDCASVTIPYLYPERGKENGETFDAPYQSLGARAVNHLASTLLNTLLPTTGPFFRLTVDLEQEVKDPEKLSQIDTALQKIETTISKEIDKRALRAHLQTALRLLITGGTVVISALDDTFRVLRLEQFVVSRNADRTIKYVIYKDTISAEKALTLVPGLEVNADKKTYILYTKQVYNLDKTVTVTQEIDDFVVVKEEFKKAPIFVVTTNILDTEDYGRSITEELSGDLFTLERLNESISQSAAFAAKHLFLVDPAGAVRGRDFAEANNGDVISGRATDITIVQSQKSTDLGIVFSHVQELTARISKAFLLSAESFPDRAMTATEARARVAEIEASLGGVYSQLSQTLQLPFLELVVQTLEAKNLIATLPDGISINIITGLDLLDRKSNVTRINEFLQLVAQLGPEAFQFINPLNTIKEIARGIGLDPEVFVVDPQDQQDPQEAMQRTQNQMMQQMADGATQGMGQAAQASVGQVTAEQAAAAMRGVTPQ